VSAASRRVGTAAWVDLATPDPDAAARFYAGLLGWTVSSDETPMGRYVTGSVGASPAAGMMAPAPDATGQPPAWTVVFRVADVDNAFDLARRLGATGLQPPLEIPGGARIAVVVDPAGATVALMDAPDPAEMAWREPGAVAWVEMQSRDVEASRRFYERLLGWEPDPELSGYRTFTLDGEQVAGLMAMPAEVPDEVPSYWLVYFSVDAVDTSIEQVRALGGSLVVPVMQVQDMRFAVVADPAGATFALLQRPG
jgi:uncharacterized protein